MRADRHDDIFEPLDSECKDIVRYVAPVEAQPEQDEIGLGDEGRQVVRAVSPSKLGWEMMEISEELAVRHGELNDDHAVVVAIEADGGPKNWIRTDDERLRRYLRAQAYKRLGRGPSKGVVDEVIAHIEARGFTMPAEPMSRRIYWQGQCLWICLGPRSQRSVRITRDGWSIVDTPPVIFYPASNAAALPEPTRGGHLDSLKQFFPSVTTESWPALVGFLLASFVNEGGYPLLCIAGPENVGKSMATELIRCLCDPVVGLDARTSMPKTPEDLYTIAANTHVISLENVSKITHEMSDALCKVLTGGSEESRKLYSQGITHILRSRNPVIMNGIGATPERPDLLSRCIVVELQAIPEERRRTEATIRQEFQAELPAILGAMFDALVVAIRDHKSTVVTPNHRLTDAGKFVTAAEPSLGLPDGSIVSAWLAAQAGAQVDLCSADPVADVLARIFKRDKVTSWRGTASDLCKVALQLEKDGPQLPADFPRSAGRLGDHLRRRSSVIKRFGFDVQRERTPSSRLLDIKLSTPDPVTPKVTVKRPVQAEGGGGTT